jgi:hypothetical protein
LNLNKASNGIPALALHDLCLRSGSHEIVVTVLDECADSDCSGCCTQNKGSADELIDVESYTNARFMVDDGRIEWADLGPTKGIGCKGQRLQLRGMDRESVTGDALPGAGPNGRRHNVKVCPQTAGRPLTCLVAFRGPIPGLSFGAPAPKGPGRPKRACDPDLASPSQTSSPLSGIPYCAVPNVVPVQVELGEP